jgi:hypothetical protein
VKTFAKPAVKVVELECDSLCGRSEIELGQIKPHGAVKNDASDVKPKKESQQLGKCDQIVACAFRAVRAYGAHDGNRARDNAPSDSAVGR